MKTSFVLPRALMERVKHHCDMYCLRRDGWINKSVCRVIENHHLLQPVHSDEYALGAAMYSIVLDDDIAELISVFSEDNNIPRNDVMAMILQRMIQHLPYTFFDSGL